MYHLADPVGPTVDAGSTTRRSREWDATDAGFPASTWRSATIPSATRDDRGRQGRRIADYAEDIEASIDVYGESRPASGTCRTLVHILGAALARPPDVDRGKTLEATARPTASCLPP